MSRQASSGNCIRVRSGGGGGSGVVVVVVVGSVEWMRCFVINVSAGTMHEDR